jgi:hypothetical protein
MVGKPEVEPPHPRRCGIARTQHQQNHAQQGAIWRSSTLLATNLPFFSGRIQLPVALRVDLLLPPCQHLLQRDIAHGAVQADLVVVFRIRLPLPP